MSSPREKEGKNEDDKEVPGPALPTTANKKTEPNDLDNRDVDQEWITIRSRADPFRRWFADLQRRQAVVPLPQPPLPPLAEYSYLSSEAMNLPQK